MARIRYSDRKSSRIQGRVSRKRRGSLDISVSLIHRVKKRFLEAD